MPVRDDAPQLNRSQLVRRIAAQKHLAHHDVQESVRLIFDYISDGLAHDNRVELRGFGTFSLRHHPPRMAFNPRTGERVMVNTRQIPHFKPGKSLRDRLRDLFQ